MSHPNGEHRSAWDMLLNGPQRAAARAEREANEKKWLEAMAYNQDMENTNKATVEAEAILNGTGPYGYGGGGGGYGGGGGGGGRSRAQLIADLSKVFESGKQGVTDAGSAAQAQLSALIDQMRRRNKDLLSANAAPYRDGLGQNQALLAQLSADLGRQGASTAGVGSEMALRDAAMRDAQARQQSLMGQYGQQFEQSLGVRQLASAQAQQNALQDLERMYAASKQRLG